MDLIEAFVDACRYGEVEDIKAMLKDPKGHEIINTTNENNQRGIFMAAANGHIDILKELLPLVSRADINVANNEGNRALHWAALNGHLDVVKLLLQYGADPILRNKMGYSAATLAEQNNHDTVANVIYQSYDPDEIEE